MRARSTSSIRLRGLRSADRARTAAPQPRSLAIDVTSPWLRRPTEQLRRGGPGRGSPPGSGAWDRLERRRRQPPCHGAGIGTCRDAGRTRLSETVDLLGSILLECRLDQTLVAQARLKDRHPSDRSEGSRISQPPRDDVDVQPLPSGLRQERSILAAVGCYQNMGREARLSRPCTHCRRASYCSRSADTVQRVSL